MIGLFLVLLLGIATTDADTHCLWSFTPSVCLFDIVDKWVSISQFLCSLCLGHDHFTQGNYLYIFFLFLFTSLSDFIGLPAWMCAFLPVSHFLSCVLWYVCTDVSPLPASLSAGGLYLIQMNCVVFQKS